MVSGLQVELNADFKALTVATSGSTFDVSNIQCYKVGRQLVITGWIEQLTSSYSSLLFQVRKAAFDLPDLMQDAYSYLMAEDGSCVRVTISQNAAYIRVQRVSGSYQAGRYTLYPAKALFDTPDYLIDVNDIPLADSNGELLIGG